MKNLEQIARGIREHEEDEAQYIAGLITEIKNEIRLSPREKINAVEKLIYLQMFGFDITFAAFPILEICALKAFHAKRVGYSAMISSFNNDTRALVMTPSQFRKDLACRDDKVQSVALSALAKVVSPEIAPYLVDDVLSLSNSTHPHIQRKALCALFRILVNKPDALSVVFQRIVSKLKSDDWSVVQVAVNILCELCVRNPSAYIQTAPPLYKIMTDTAIRDRPIMLVKLLKIFRAFLKAEPKLKKKLVSPLQQFLNGQYPLSVTLEALFCVVESFSSSRSLLQRALELLQQYLEDDGENSTNLHYCALELMVPLIETAGGLLEKHRRLVINCLNSKDNSIQLKALKVVEQLVDEDCIEDIVQRLIEIAQLSSIDNRIPVRIIEAVLRMITRDSYADVPDFDWLLSTFQHIALLKCCIPVDQVALEFRQFVLRCEDIQEDAARIAKTILLHMDKDPKQTELMSTCFFIVGEFGSIEDDFDLDIIVPQSAQSAQLTAMFKISTKMNEPDRFSTFYDRYLYSVYSDIQWHAAYYGCLSKMKDDAVGLGALFENKLNAVSKTAQERVAAPFDLTTFLVAEAAAIVAKPADKEEEEVIIKKKRRRKKRRSKEEAEEPIASPITSPASPTKRRRRRRLKLADVEDIDAQPNTPASDKKEENVFSMNPVLDEEKEEKEEEQPKKKKKRRRKKRSAE
ncbi:hypothetical protein PCE1_001051 [Barthelona sp. PCE]